MTFLLSQLAGQAHASTTKFGCYFVRGSGCVQAQETYLELWHQCRWVLYDGLEQLQIQTIIRLRPPVQLNSRKLILFAVNNNPDASAAEGGSHWSDHVSPACASSPFA